MARNPVMFVTEIGAAFATILFFKDLGDATAKANVFAGSIAAWLWFTVLFANFAEAMAEGRGKAQAATLRKTRAETTARRRLADGTIEEVPSSQLAVGDHVVVTAGEIIPPTETWSRASPASTSRRSPASPPRSSASRAATAPPSRAARACCRTRSSSASRRAPARASSTA